MGISDGQHCLTDELILLQMMLVMTLDKTGRLAVWETLFFSLAFISDHIKVQTDGSQRAQS